MERELDNLALENLLAILTKGHEPSEQEFRERFPGHESTIRRLYDLYRSLADPESIAASALGSLRPGIKFDEFVIERLIGRGGMGEVYCAEQPTLARQVALKVLPRSAVSQRAAARFQREAKLLSRLSHPRLLPIHKFGEAEGMSFFAMRLIEGPTLQRVLEQVVQHRMELPSEATQRKTQLRQTPQRRIVMWIAQIADALAEVHKTGLVHRDVKPSNIMVELSAGSVTEDSPESRGSVRAPSWLPDGEAVLVDFGLIREIEGATLTVSGPAPATVSYAPPEQIEGGGVTSRSDVFSLGATLHDLLAARLPRERLPAHRGLEPLLTIVPDMDRDLAEVVSKATEREPGFRYADARAFGVDLRAWLAGEPVTARRWHAAKRFGRWVHAQPWRVVQILLATVLVVTLGGALTEYYRYSGSAQRAQDAFQAGDLATLARASQEVPPALRRVFLGSAVLAEFWAQFQSTDSEAPLAEIVEHLRSSRPKSAFRAAAKFLRAEGYTKSPLLVRFLAHSLRLAQTARSTSETGSMRTEFLTSTSLLYLERGVDPTEFSVTTEVRGVLREYLDSDELSADDRLLVVSAMSGCGEPVDAETILDWGLEQAPYSEAIRMAAASCARLFNRFNHHDFARCLDFPALEDKVARLLRRMHDGSDASRFDKGTTWGHYVSSPSDLAVAFAAARLSAGLSGELSSRGIPQKYRTDAIEHPLRARYASPLLAIERDADFLVALRKARPELNPRFPDFNVLGTLCGLTGDDNVIVEARFRCAGVAGGAANSVLALANFEAGVRNGLARRRGEDDRDAPDAPSLMGAEAPDGIPSLSLRYEQREQNPTMAGWSFQSSCVHGTATSCQPTNCCIELDEAAKPHLLMHRFGESEIDLEFELSRTERLPVAVMLHHLAAIRAGLPQLGRAFLEIRLDGTPIRSALEVSCRGDALQRIDLPQRRINPGRHRLTIRLHETSNTTYRLFGVELSCIRLPKPN